MHGVQRGAESVGEHGGGAEQARVEAGSPAGGCGAAIALHGEVVGEDGVGREHGVDGLLDVERAEGDDGGGTAARLAFVRLLVGEGQGDGEGVQEVVGEGRVERVLAPRRERGLGVLGRLARGAVLQGWGIRLSGVS